jgi:hypothetical protein
MPKKNIEIKNFDKGIASSTSSNDVNENSPKYSKNLESHLNNGKLQGVNTDTILTNTGFNDYSVFNANQPYINEISLGFHNHNSHLAINPGPDKATTITNLKAGGDNYGGALFSHGVYAKLTGMYASVGGHNFGSGTGVAHNLETLPFPLGNNYACSGHNGECFMAPFLYTLLDYITVDNKSTNWDDVIHSGNLKNLLMFDQAGYLRCLSHVSPGNADAIYIQNYFNSAFIRGELNPTFINTNFDSGQYDWDGITADGSADYDATNDGWVFGAGKMLNPFNLYFLKINNKGVFFRLRDTSAMPNSNAGPDAIAPIPYDFSLDSEIANTPPIHDISMNFSMMNPSGTTNDHRRLFFKGIRDYLNDDNGTSPFKQEIYNATFSEDASDADYLRLVIKFNSKFVPYSGANGLDNVDLAIQYASKENNNSIKPSFNDLDGMFSKQHIINDGSSYNEIWTEDSTIEFSEESINPIIISTSEFITKTQKDNRNKIDLIGLRTNNNDIPLNFFSINDIFSDEIDSVSVIPGASDYSFTGLAGKYNLLSDSDSVFVGLGGSKFTPSKVILKPDKNKLATTGENSLEMFDAALKRPNLESVLSEYTEFVIHPIEGYATLPKDSYLDAAGTNKRNGQIYNDNNLAISNNTHDSGWNRTITYDFVLDNSSSLGSVSLYEALNGQESFTQFVYADSDGVTQKGETGDTIQIGQIFITRGTNDFEDNGMRAWKRYDYDETASVVAGDLFMFCGYMANTNDVPILRYIGNTGHPNSDTDTVGTPAFAYAFKNDVSKIYKISLTTTGNASSDTAFAGGTAGSVQGSDDVAVTITNVGNRVTSFDLSSLVDFPSSSISALSMCQSPTLYNSINLKGEGVADDPHSQWSKMYYYTGDLKVLYRHGVFYVAIKDERQKLYRVNLIDFHNLTSIGPLAEDLTLNFDNIPSQLWAEDGDGMIRRTIEDQTHQGEYDPKSHNFSKIPSDAYIIGICETFEGGSIIGMTDVTSNYSTSIGDSEKAWEFETKNNNRLTTGDKIKFYGFGSAAAGSTNSAITAMVNLQAPLTVNNTDTNKFIVRMPAGFHPVAGSYMVDNNVGYQGWWNAKVWVLYGRPEESTNDFSDWDMFLYNANTLDMTENRVLDMADRTPPYHQARYYINSSSPAGHNGHDNGLDKVYYPGQFAFHWIPFAEAFSTTPGTWNYSYIEPGQHGYGGAYPTEATHDISSSSMGGASYDEVWPLWGIYDKSGRWLTNGTDTHLKAQDDYRPRGWVGGTSGPNSLDIAGNMEWGHNIGWDIDTGRNIKTVRNSLHPKVYHSCIYKSWEVWPGHYRRHGSNQEGTANTASDLIITDETSTSMVKPTSNDTGHAVTFLGKTTGDFVVSPGPMTREQFPSTEGGNSGNTWGMKSHFTTGYNADRRFVKTYNDEYTLYTIDDYSGHKGIVKSGSNDNVGDIENTTASIENIGLVESMPNWGGPEIEHPFILAYDYERDDGFGAFQVGTHSSVNKGNPYDGNLADNISPGAGVLTDNTNKGWDGYKPPSLFNPGKGYYVYINRAWKCHSPFHIGSLDSYIAEADNGTNRNPVQNEGWGFQYHDALTSNVANWKLASNRFHNFSSTALADSLSKNEGIYSIDPYGFNGEELIGQSAYSGGGASSPWDIDFIRSRFDSGLDRITGDNSRSLSPFRTTMNVAAAVCTMHKLLLPSNTTINNICPIIMMSNANRTASTSEVSTYQYPRIDSDIVEVNTGFPYRPGYLCGIKTESAGVTSSGALILTTNFDSAFNQFAWDTININNPDNQSKESLGYPWVVGDCRNPGIFTTHSRYMDPESGGFSDTFGDNGKGYFPLSSRGTHFAEVINISPDTTKLKANYSSEGDEMCIEGLATDSYSSDRIYENLKLLPQKISSTAVKGIAYDFDGVFALASNSENTNNYFGHQDTFYIPDKSPSAAATTFNTDSSGTFFTADSGEIFTDSELTSANGTVLLKTSQVIEVTKSSSSATGSLQPGTYMYKIAYEYDNAYESPLQTERAFIETIADADISDGHTGIDNIKFSITYPQSTIDSLSRRITGLSVYRKLDMNDFDLSGDFLLLDVIKFNDKDWVYNASSSTYTYDLFDTGNTKAAYSILNGIDESIKDTNLNYFLSTVHHGYLYVSGAWHDDLDDVERYIFRSAPDNFYAFNWIEDYIVMPEVPIAMVSFNSRLYVWGERKLYKVDPYNLLIEEEYEGISIVNKDAFVKTEYGLFFIDSNNIYMHDGNKPLPIGNSILTTSDRTILWDEVDDTALHVAGYYKVEQGYLELLESTLKNKHKPNIFYMAKNNSIIIVLSDSSRNGVALSYNIARGRWDLFDAPAPVSISSSKNSTILINDNNQIYNYMGSVSREFYKYNRKSWEWISKDLDLGADTQQKVFKSMSLSGLPTIYNKNENAINTFIGDDASDSIQAFVDGKQVKLTLDTRNIRTEDMGKTQVLNNAVEVVNLNSDVTTADTFFAVNSRARVLSSEDGVSTPTISGIQSLQSYLQPGQYIKINDEIMLIIDTKIYLTRHSNGDLIDDEVPYTMLEVLRGQLGTTITSHKSAKGTGSISGDDSNTSIISVVSPRFKFAGGTKGRNLELRFLNQNGYIDSIGVVFKHKSVK